jgi:2-hydroxy-3-oxopropionate reductase
MSNIGFIGLGIMGNAMSRNLLKAGHSLVVYDVVPQLVDVITMLPDGPEVEQAMLGPRRCC